MNEPYDDLAEFLRDAEEGGSSENASQDSSSDANEPQDADADSNAPEDSADNNSVASEASKPKEPVEPDNDPVAELKRQNEALIARINELSGMLQKNASAQQAQASGSGSASDPSSDEDETDFFGDWTFEKIIESEESFKTFLSGFAKKIAVKTEETILRKIPGTVSKVTMQQLEVQRKAEEFYAAHPQLASTKPFVAQIANVVSSEHPDWDFDQVLQETANRAYSALGLSKKVLGTKAPAFGAPTKGDRGQTQPPKKSRLEQEIEELLY